MLLYSHVIIQTCFICLLHFILIELVFIVELADGQTGSGKTHTMVGIQNSLANDLFQLMETEEEVVGKGLQVYVSFFEIYGGRCQDLLNNRNRLNVSMR